MSGQEPIRRDPKYRPNHNRSITISGIIDDALVARLLPEIVRLQSFSRDPITAYIDSPGGDTRCARLLLDALRASDQDRSEPCRLITVALGDASSAASDILTAGDYALAYPYSIILCHGTRHIIDRPVALTKDRAATYAKQMAGLDESYAVALARNCINRFMFRITRIREELARIENDDVNQNVAGSPSTAIYSASRIALFLGQRRYVGDLLLNELRIAGTQADSTALIASSSGLIDLCKQMGNSDVFVAKIRAEVLHQAREENVIDLGGLEARFLLLRDFFDSYHDDTARMLAINWELDLLDQDDIDESGSRLFASDDDRKRWITMKLVPRCLRLWFLFVFFCRQLQTGDFPMTATEAYWLGLIDEVIGLDLASPRILVENAPDLPNEPQGVSQP